MKRLLFLSLVAFLLASCAQEEIGMPEVSGGEATTVRSLEDALKIADSFLLSLDDNTRAGSRIVESVEYLGGNAATRSEDGAEKPMYYVVNYADDQGFAILSADTRLTPVYAISPEGSVNLADTLINPAFRAFVKSLPKDEAGIRRVVHPGDITTTYNLKKIVKPLLPLNVRKWDQLMYNDDVRKYCNGNPKTLVGRMPLATAQVFAFFKAPTYVSFTNLNGSDESFDIDWDRIIAGNDRDSLCKLFEALGSNGFYNCTYGIDKTTSKGSNFYVRVFRKVHYYFRSENRSDQYTDFNFSLAAEHLKQYRYPIIVEGEFLLDPVDMVYDDYTWVIDGYATAESFQLATGGGTYTMHYFHMVWGNAQNCDGYYYFNPKPSDDNPGNGIFSGDIGEFSEDDKSDNSFGFSMGNCNMYFNYLPDKLAGV